MSDFLEIVKQYSSDIANETGTDKITAHSYGEIYANILSKLKERSKNNETIDILEIGIYSGGFLRAMSDYMPNANIYGIDITLSGLRFINNQQNVYIHQLDGTDPSTPITLNKTFDLIIEDGSHRTEDQIKSLDIFASYLKSGGIYITEDISNSTVEKLKPELEKLASKYDLKMDWVDLQHVKGRWDDILAIFTKEEK